MMYFNSQTSSGVPTVESTISKDAGKQNGEAYAAFLNTLGKWNIYNTYTSQLDAGVGIVGKIMRGTVGVVILGCMYLMDGLDGLLQITADLVGYLNVFSYLVDDSGNILKVTLCMFCSQLLICISNLMYLRKFSYQFS